MDKPLCRLCNTKHYSGEPHHLPKGKKKVVRKKIEAAPGKKSKGKFDRVAYQKEYMRKRRARANKSKK